MRKQEKFVVWPVYFDQGKSRSEGRKVPKSLAQPSPRLEEIAKAAQRLGLQPELRLDLAYPDQPWLKSGMLLVGKKGSKLELIRRIAKELAAQRVQKSG